MALKYKINYKFTAKIGDKEIKFKEWTAKEERKYLQAMENEKTKITDKLIFDLLILPCVEDKELVLSVQEQKYLLIEIRKVSIGQTFNDKITCSECEKETEYEIKIDDICSYEKAKYSKIEIKNEEENFIFNIGPIRTNKEKEKLVLDNGIINYIFADFLLHIHSIEIDGELNEGFRFKELTDFMDSLPTRIFDEVFEKYQVMVDSLELKYKYKCPHCAVEDTKEYETIPNFLWI
jgi:hypothetical protein